MSVSWDNKGVSLNFLITHRLWLLLLPLLLFVTLAPLASAHYYVILDENLSEVYPYASEVAKLHNGTVVVSDFSNLSFLRADDYALIVVGYSKFSEMFVYSLYKSLDFNDDGIYDPILGFLPVREPSDLSSFVSALSNFKPGRAVFIRAGEVSYEKYMRLSRDVSLVWLEGHGSPSGVDMGGWRFDSSRVGEPSGKVFVLESCDVGKIWESNDSLVMVLVRKGSPAVVASIDMGGVSYLPSEFWASGYPIGRLAQVSNAYFIKVGINPKVVVFGDPALVPVNGTRYRLVRSHTKGLYARLFPAVNGYIYTPSNPGFLAFLAAYHNLVSVMDLWRGVVTMEGLGVIFLASVLLFAFGYLRPKKETALKALGSSVGAFLVLGLIFGFPPVSASIMIVLFWTGVALLMEKKAAWSFLALFLPPLFITSLAFLGGWTTLSYAVFVVLVSLLGSLIVLAVLYGARRLLISVANSF